MAASDFDLKAPSDRALPTLPSVKLPVMLQMGLFQTGIGIMSVLTLAVLNRVMISELAIPATITASAIALPQLLTSPAKVWFGQLSDSRPLFGTHRTGYVRLAPILFGTFVFLSVQAMWQLGSAVRSLDGWAWTPETTLWTAVLALLFVGYGLTISLGTVPFTTLLVDVTDDENRSKITSLAWSMLMVGIVSGAIFGSQFLERIQPSSLVFGANVGTSLLAGEKAIATPIAELQPPINSLFVVVPAIVFGLAILATLGVEKRYSRYEQRTRSRQDSGEPLTLARALKVVTSSRQTGIFFTFLIVFTFGLFLQEAVLEPYGGEVFEMSIADTTKLNAVWGVGLLFGLGSSGFFLANRLGTQNTAKLGCLLVAICFAIVILAGFSREPDVLRGAIFTFGIAAGITTTGALSLMLDLTVAETAGTFIGTWGLAQGIARGFATVIGGILLDVGKLLFAQPVLAYGLVFLTQSLLMLLAIALLNRVNVQEFRSRAQSALMTMMESDLDG